MCFSRLLQNLFSEFIRRRQIGLVSYRRISIARALLRDKPVLILDEATSALDEDTEAMIFERITKQSNKTCFIITHRRSMLKYCDMMMEIDKSGKATLTDNKNKQSI